MSTLPITPYLTRIDLYPIKSLDGISLDQAQILPSGALQGDRTFALFDAQGKVINGKRTARMHQVRSHFSADGQTLTLWVQGVEQRQTFPWPQERAQVERWFSDYFQQPVTIQENYQMGWPDDTSASGPTLVSTATLEAVAAWYPDLDLTEIRQRFRTNLEIGGVPAFWEDQLFGAADATVPFQIGAVTFWGINPCQRCIVPTRDPQTGEGTANFQKTFIQQRAATLPAAARRSRFNHFYRLAVNTRLPETEAGKVLKLGDTVQLG